MSAKPWKLPWRGKMVPHAVIDILRECNITCRACYNSCPPDSPKTLKDVRDELDALLKMRRLSSVSIAGGEVCLHPQLCDIIRMITGKGVDVELITNGLLIDDDFCVQLKQSGLSMIYFHIERGQTRKDLADSESVEDIQNLRLEKVRMATRHGLDAGLTITAYPGEEKDLHDIMSLTLNTPEINYLLVTLFRDNSGIKSLKGNIISGFTGTGEPPRESKIQNNKIFTEWMVKEFELAPFGAMYSNLDENDPRWLSYLIGTVYNKEGEAHYEYIKPSILEKFAMLIFRIAGRYPMYMKQKPDLFRKQLILNGLVGGRYKSNMKLVKRSGKPGVKLTTKRLLFQNPAELTDDGRLIHCDWCPDAVLKNGTLVPVCIADHVS